MGGDVELARRVSAAVRSIECPAGLEHAIRARISMTQAAAPNRPMVWFSMAAFATMLVIGTAISVQVSSLRSTAISEDGYLSRLADRIPAAFRPGLLDHVHCAVLRKYSSTPPPAADLVSQMGPRYAGLIEVMREHVPVTFQILAAHQCRYRQARYVHITLGDGPRRMSLILAARHGTESLSEAGLSAAVRAGGHSVFATSVDQFQIAAFEAGEFSAYLVSDEDRERNLAIAAAIAPAVIRAVS